MARCGRAVSLGVTAMKSIFLLVSATVVWVANASPAIADLIGTTVSGVMNVGGGSFFNFFDPALGFVPAGFGNSAPNGPNNVIIGAGTEFGFDDTANRDTFDFTGTQVTFTDVSVDGSLPIVFSFTDTAFGGATISLQSSKFPVAISQTLVGNVLTLSTPDFRGTGGTFVATFNITTPPAVPGPIVGTGLPGLILACGILLALARHRHKSA